MKKKESVDNFLKVVRFQFPEWIPAIVSLMPATWMKYREDLEQIVLEHPSLFPDYKKEDFKNLKMRKHYIKGTCTDI
jgi:hypothetical protein